MNFASLIGALKALFVPMLSGAQVTAGATAGAVGLNSAQQAVDQNGNAWLSGPLVSGQWSRCPTMFRLRLVGIGAVTLDAKNTSGTVTTGVYSISASGATDQIAFPFIGNDASYVRATFANTVTVEML